MKKNTMKKTWRMAMTTTLERTFAALCLLALAGCGRGELTLSEAEARERTSGAYAAAMDDLQAGRIDHAVEGFEKVIRDEPRSHSAHFQLATLLQDAKHDYIGAIAHYREYRALRPGADKAALAKDREALCERLLAAQFQKAVAPGEAESALKAENAKLAAEVKKAKAEVAELSAALEESNKKAKVLGEEVASLRKMLSGIGASSESDGTRPQPIKISEAALLDDDGDDAKPIDRIAMSEDLKFLKIAGEDGEKKAPFAEDAPADGGKEGENAASAAGKQDGDSGRRAFDSLFAGQKDRKEKKDSGNSRPATYTVQQGDTLFRISERFYGSPASWRKIREANKATVPTDGRVNAGQVLILP